MAFLKGEEPPKDDKDDGPTRADLLEQAKAKGIKGAASMKKDELVEALAKVDEAE